MFMDKVLHFTVCAIITLIVGVLLTPFFGLCYAILTGFIKEAMDCFFVFSYSKPFVRYIGFKPYMFSIEDFVFDIAGALISFFVLLFLI